MEVVNRRPEEQEREGGDRWNGCYSILTDQSEGGEICILSTLYPHSAKEATLRWRDSALRYKLRTAYSRWFVSRCWIDIASNNNNPVVYQKKWIYIFMTLSSDDFMIIISQSLLECMMRGAQLLRFVAYGGENQRFNQIISRPQDHLSWAHMLRSNLKVTHTKIKLQSAPVCCCFVSFSLTSVRVKESQRGFGWFFKLMIKMAFLSSYSFFHFNKLFLRYSSVLPLHLAECPRA